ncbi:MAG: DUF3367 domain-containing protein [Acidimicrobiia bacterium]|nr:DUF3367 domain-containing protein [Acidimicrobiia bacterium]
MTSSTTGERSSRWATLVVPALVAYLPLLATAPGWVGADTKTYLYLDPGRLLAEAPYVWHDRIGLGTVTHQNIGYLFPMGPYYFVMETLGVPDWVAQRLWLGTILFGAAMGVRHLIGTLAPRWRIEAPGAVVVASLAYMLSPYFLAYAARISVILLPWAALPWLLAFTARALRSGGWRQPALFAFAVLVVGGINATALILVGLGPLLWVAWAVWVEREVTWRQALAACARIGVLTLATSLWWIAGLWASGRYGLPVLRYTETYRTVAEVSSATEVTRGLGYWFFYGGDKLGPWIEPSVSYTQDLPLIVLSFALPVLALVAMACVRWRFRGLFLLLFCVGGLTAVAAHPWSDPSVLGGLFKSISTTDAGLSMRSTPRAVPLLALATAMGLGAGLVALTRRLPRRAPAVTVLVALLVVANVPPLWSGDLVADNLKRPEELPAYWPEVAAALDERPHTTRVLEMPGADFASYRWGNTVDPVTPGLMDRPYAARELFQWGSPQSANLLNALDRRLHEDVIDPEAIAPLARLLGVGDIVVRSDLQYERYRIARPQLLWDHLARADGLGPPEGFGPQTANRAGPEHPMIDEVRLGARPDLEDPPPVAILPVTEPRSLLRTVTAAHPLLLAGDGEGVVDAASVGVVSPDQLLLYAASVAADEALLDQSLAAGADLVVTDTNRRRSQRWGALRENTGYTERAGETPIDDPSDQRLEVFPEADDDSATVSSWQVAEGATIGAVVTATAYGNPITFTPDDRPANALDGDSQTAWRVGAIDEARGERLRIELDEAVTADHIEVLQPVNLERNRWITEVRLSFDDDDTIDVTLEDISRDESAVGQRIDFPARTFETLEFEILETNISPRPRYDGFSGVGFAEVRIPGVGIEELVRPPTDLLDVVGARSAEHRLVYVLSRLRSNPAEPVRLDEESGLRRLLTVPTTRAFSLAGQARLSPHVADDVIDALLGLDDHTAGGVTATSSNRLPGSFRHRASSAIDGDLSTHWSPIFGQQREHFLEFRTAEPVAFDRLALAVVADGRHSVPTRLRIEAATDDAEPVPVAAVELPAIEDGTEVGTIVELDLPLTNEVVGDHLVVVVEQVRQVPVRDWYSDGPNIAPVGIAELGIEGLAAASAPAQVDTGCRDDLLTIDGDPVPLRVTGQLEDAVDRRALDVSLCDGGDGAVELAAGDTVLRTTPGRRSGIDIDRLRLSSEAGGAPLAPALLPREVPSGPELALAGSGRVTHDATVAPADDPYWVVLAQSFNDGWEADLAVGSTASTSAAPTLVNGFANGWFVEPDGEPVEVHIAWTPQRVVWVALVISLLAGLGCVALAIGRPGRRSGAGQVARATDDGATATWPFGVSSGYSWPVALVVGVVVTVAAGLNVPTDMRMAAAPVLGAVAVAVFRWRRGRDLAVVLAGLGVAVAGAYVVLQQFRHGFPPDFAWPVQFSRAHLPAWAALALAGVAALRDAFDRRAATTPTPTTEPVSPAVGSDMAALDHD